MKRLLLALALVALFTAPALADRSMAGGYCNLIGPTTANPGDLVTFEFYVWNGSTDTEWTADVIFTFPECFEVTGGYYDDGGAGWSFVFNGIGTNVGAFNDGDGGYGEIYGSEGGTFYVEVLLGTDCECGPVTIHWFQQGDIWGSDPHFVEGDLPFTICGTPTEDATWSSVKSLY